MNFLNFAVNIYGNLEPYNDVLSKARLRIFYKYGNRNGTFITDEFAKELISTLPYTPVKGIYEDDDFADHGENRSDGRIYGIVPETTNFAWEKHLDEDGVEREYACTDVLLFTALYTEAEDIIGKAQSMELYEPSLQYHRADINGQKYIVFDHGRFLGLQVLGDDVEPCFEGASFYTLQNKIEETINQIKKYSKEAAKSMQKINFKLSDSHKHDAIWSLLNENFNEENNWEVSYGICDIFDDYALVFNYEDGSYERVYYTKNDEEDSVVLGQRKKCYVMDITEEEKNTLDTLRRLNGDTYELVNENLLNAEENFARCAELGTKIEELNNSLATLQQEVSERDSSIEDYTSKNDELNQQLTSVMQERDELQNYKHNVELHEKETVFEQYADKLSDEIIGGYRAKIDEYTAVDLDKELTYELKKIGFVFGASKNNGYIPKDQDPDGIEMILSRYHK